MSNLPKDLSIDNVLLFIRSNQLEREKGYAYIFRELTPYLWRVVQHVVDNLDHERTADIVSQAWVDIWQQIETFDPARASLKTWASTITHHKAVNYLRTLGTRIVDEEPYEELVKRIESGSTATTPDPLELATARHIQEEFLSELMKLDKTDIFLYLVRLNYDLDYKELSQITEAAGQFLTEKAIQNRFYRVRDKILDILHQKQVLD